MSNPATLARSLPTSRPRSLTIVAALFLVFGAAAALDMLASVLHERFVLNVGVSGLWIGMGLLKLRSGWRTWALAFTWFGLGTAVFCLLGFLLPLGEPVVRSGGLVVGNVSRAWFFALVVVSIALQAWQLRVLMRSDVRALFEPRAT